MGDAFLRKATLFYGDEKFSKISEILFAYILEKLAQGGKGGGGGNLQVPVYPPASQLLQRRSYSWTKYPILLNIEL